MTCVLGSDRVASGGRKWNCNSTSIRRGATIDFVVVVMVSFLYKT